MACWVIPTGVIPPAVWPSKAERAPPSQAALVSDAHMDQAPQTAANSEFDRLFFEHAGLVERAATNITRNPDDASDVLQSIFLRLVAKGIPDELRQNPRAYLHRSAVNEALNLLRWRKNQKLVRPPEQTEEEGESEQDFFDRVSRKKTGLNDTMTHKLNDAIDQLEPEAIEILYLHYRDGHSDTEIAQQLGTKRGTVASTLSRIRAKLKENL